MKIPKALLFLTLLGAGFASRYHLDKTLPIGGEGRWDYVVAADNRLYVPRSTHTTVLDAKSGKTLADFPDTPGVHGVALVPSLHRAFTSNGKDGTSTVIDTSTLKLITKVKTVVGADCVIYDPFSSKVLSFSGKENSMLAIDAKTYKADPAIPLGGKAEYAVSDGKGHVWVNVEDKAEVVKIDMRKGVVEGHFPITGGDEPTGLAMDHLTHRLFIGCHNEKLVVMNSDSGKVVATLPISKGVDATAFDGSSVLASCGDGKLWVYREVSRDSYKLLQTVTTEPGARTMALDSQSHKVYLPTATMIPSGEERPKVKEGTFRILVVGSGR